MISHFKLKNYDFKLIIMVVLLAIIGVMAIGSAEGSLRTKQMYGVIAGVFVMIVLSFINYSFWLKMYWLFYAGNLALLLMVIFMGESGGGAQRWLKIGIQFQPSESAKILLILFFAQFIMKYREKLNTFKIVVMCLGLIGVPVALILKQPDLSTSIVVIVTFCVIMFAGGISGKLIIAVFAVTIPAFVVMITLILKPDSSFKISEYQQNRILAYVSPEEYPDLAYQQMNSIMAIGSGQLDGKGYQNNEITSVKNGDFISEAETDFIFAVIGEEFGFKGSVVVIVLLIGISLECIHIARRAKDMAGRIIAAGVGGLVAFQGFINIGVATFLLPNTGLPLPFVSYGLTSLLCLFAAMGFVLNVRLQAPRLTPSNG